MRFADPQPISGPDFESSGARGIPVETLLNEVAAVLAAGAGAGK